MKWPHSKQLFGGRGYCLNQIEHAWCQSIGNGGQRIQILHLFNEMIDRISNFIFESKNDQTADFVCGFQNIQEKK